MALTINELSALLCSLYAWIDFTHRPFTGWGAEKYLPSVICHEWLISSGKALEMPEPFLRNDNSGCVLILALPLNCRVTLASHLTSLYFIRMIRIITTYSYHEDSLRQSIQCAQPHAWQEANPQVMVGGFGVNRATHVGCTSDMGHNGATNIQRRVRQVDPSPSPMPMCGLGLIVCAPERKVIRGFHFSTNLPGFSVSPTFSRVKSLCSVRL